MSGAITIRSIAVSLGFIVDTKKGEKFKKQVDIIGKGLDGLSDKAKKFAIGFGASVAAAFGVASIREFLAEQQEVVKEIEQRRGAIAATSEEMQQLGFVARESGFEMADLSDAIADLAEKAADATLTGAGYQENLDRIGLSATDAAGNIKAPIDLFLEFSDAMKKLPEGATKTFIAMELMGDAGKNMLPLLNKGSEGIREMMMAADAAGFVMTDSTIAATKEYSEASRRLTDAIVMLKSTALDKLLPIITAITRQITAWLMDTNLITEALLRLRQAAIITGAALAAMAVGKFARALTQLPALLATVTNAMRSLRAVLLSTSAAMIAIPLAIAGILLVGQDLFTWIQGGDSLIGRFIDKWAESDGILGTVARTILDLRPTIEVLFDTLSRAASVILPALTSMLSKLADAFMTALAPAIINVVTELADTLEEMGPVIAEVAVLIADVLADVVVMAAKIIAVLATTIFPIIRALLPLVVSIINGILNVVAMLLPAVTLVISVIAAIISTLAPIVGGIISIITDIIVGLAAIITAIIVGIAELAMPIIEAIAGGITEAVDVVGGALNVLIGWFRDAFDIIAAIIKPVTDAIGSVVKGVAAITGGSISLDSVARAAPRAALSVGGRVGSAAGASAGGINVGGVSVSVGGTTNMGPGDLTRSVRTGTIQGILEAQRRAAAREIG